MRNDFFGSYGGKKCKKVKRYPHNLKNTPINDMLSKL